MESRVSTSLSRSTSETWSVCDRASVRTMKSKSAAVNRARQFARTIGASSCAIHAPMASHRFTRMNQEGTKRIVPYYGVGDGDGFVFVLCCLAGFPPGDAAGLGNGAAFGAAIVF